jgi:exosortase/archaeosortase family protein
MSSMYQTFSKEKLRFLVVFTITFFLLYGFNLVFIGFTTKGGHYEAFLDYYLNYIEWWRSFTIRATGGFLRLLGYQVFEQKTQLKVYMHGGFTLIYSCLGYGIMSLFTAFVISYPKVNRGKPKFLLTGLILIQCLNILRFVALALFWKADRFQPIDHHMLFNGCLYIILLTRIYLWINNPINTQTSITDA